MKKRMGLQVGALAFGTLLAASAMADTLSDNVGGIFPGFYAWQSTPGTSLAVSVNTHTDVSHTEFVVGTGERLDKSLTSRTTTLRAIAEASIGRNRVFGSGFTINEAGTAYALSLWKDTFVIGQSAKVGIQLHIDGTVPLVPNGVPVAYGNSIAI